MIGCSEQNNTNNAPEDSKPTTTGTADQQSQSENNDQQTSNENNTHKSNGQNNHGNRRGGRGGRSGRGNGRGGRGGGRGGSVEVNNKDVSELCAKMLHEDPEDFLEIMQQNKEIPLYPMKQFDQIIESRPILQVLNDLNFFQPSKIQSQAIPILNDKERNSDLIAQAESGSGKTIAALVPMLLHVNGDEKVLQTICLCHTRELIIQTFDVFKKMNEYTKFEGDICVKNSKEGSETPPSKTAQLLFGTPTSICYWIEKGQLDVSKVKFLIIDEADEILNKYGTFFNSTQKLMGKLLPKNVQYGFFSSIFKESVVEYIKRLRPNIITIRLRRNQQKVQTIKHWYTKVNNMDQAKTVILDLVTSVSIGQTLVFTRSKAKIQEISNFLNSNNVQCKPYSSDLKTDERDKTLDEFRHEEFKVLITSDVLARGIDIPNTYLVINLETPIRVYEKPNHYQFNYSKNRQSGVKVIINDCDTYYRRAGFVGRFGRSGLCFTIALDKNDEMSLKKFCNENNLNIPLNYIDKDKIADLPEEKVIVSQAHQDQQAASEPADQEVKA